jgi:AcrR family transcriptional regulator
VRVADVAAAAEVSEATVFNYFATKEELVYQGMEAFEAEMLQAIRDRPSGEPVIEAFKRFVLTPRGLLVADDETAARSLTAVSRAIADSPALLAHEREIFARYTDSLAALIAEEAGTGPEDARPWVVANALMGVHRALIYFARARLTDEVVDRAKLARDIRTQGQRAIALLEKDLAGYDPKPAARN